ncbi:MAG: CdaR family protein [Desulfobacteraceae bacterium]|nr:CdaR family protein [Desulfobacteraceae bacterium]
MEKLVKQILGHGPGGQPRPWTQNWTLKLISLCFAIFLWYFVVGEDKVDTTLFIPIEIVNLPRDLVISNQFKNRLEVTVSGPRGLVRGLTGQSITRPVDLSSATPGTVVVRNDPGSIPFPRGIKVLRIQPTHIIFLLDRLIQKDLAIKPIIEGTPPDGYQLGSIKLDPSTITITGPQAVLGKEETLITNPINVSGLTGPITKQVTLNLKPWVADLVGEPVVTADIKIREKTVERRIARLPVEASGRPGEDYDLRPPTVNVRAELPLGLIKNTPNLKTLFLAQINLADLPPGTHQVPVQVNATKEVRIIDVSPATVAVRIKAPRTAASKRN